jgi:opine dehydrogenase
MINKITILGAGNGGQALSAHMAIKGCEVTLFEHPKFKENVEKINKKGGVELTGGLKGFGKIPIATTNIKEAIEDASIIMIVAPSFAQKAFIELALPYLVNSQIIVLIPGNFGSFGIKKILKNNGKNLTIAETNSLPYACRKVEEGKVDIWGVKSYLSIATLPAANIENVMERLSNIFPIPLSPAKNSLEISFSNPNMIVHCPTMILNAGRIESTKGNFIFYRDGVTESVYKIMEKMDRERIKIGEKLNLNLISTFEWFKRTYSLEGENLYKALSTSSIHGGHEAAGAPKVLSHRYLTEDVPHLLVPVASFGKLLGIQTPIIECIIKLASAINGVDYSKTGRNLEALGLSKMKLEEILNYIS